MKLSIELKALCIVSVLMLSLQGYQIYLQRNQKPVTIPEPKIPSISCPRAPACPAPICKAPRVKIKLDSVHERLDKIEVILSKWSDNY